MIYALLLSTLCSISSKLCLYPRWHSSISGVMLSLSLSSIMNWSTSSSFGPACSTKNLQIWTLPMWQAWWRTVCPVSLLAVKQYDWTLTMLIFFWELWFLWFLTTNSSNYKQQSNVFLSSRLKSPSNLWPKLSNSLSCWGGTILVLLLSVDPSPYGTAAT